MTRIILLIFTAIILHGCAAQKGVVSEGELVSVYLTDQNGINETISNPERLKHYAGVNFLSPQPYQKIMRTYKQGSKGEAHTYLTTYHENGHVKQYLEAQNTRAQGIYREWHPNGVMRIDAYVIGGDADLTPDAETSWLFDGCCRVWNESGCLEAEIRYSRGELEGNSTYYHTNGAVWKQIPYHQSKIEGRYEIYLKSGELLQTINYDKGVPQGSSTRFWPGGETASEEVYDQGRLISGAYYNLQGLQISEVKDGNGHKALFGQHSVSEFHQYKNGVPEGVVQIFSTDGMLLKQFHIKDNLKHGEEVEFYDPLFVQNAKTPKLAISWYEGKIQGAVKTWYENGVQESQREYSNNLKNGLSTAWYRDGSLMLIEEYEKDKINKGEYYKKGDPFFVSQVKEGAGTVTFFDSEGNFLEKAEYMNGMPAE